MKRTWILLAVIVLLAVATGVAQEQPPAQPSSQSPTATTSPSDLEQLKTLVLEQQKQLSQAQDQLAQQQRELEDLKQQLQPRVVNATLSTSAAPRTLQPASDAAAPPQETAPKPSPLSFRIGAAEFTPGGFVDFENIFRSTNTGNVTATGFGAIPFSNTVQGHLTEFRSTGQYSRFNIKTTAKYGKNDVTGYIEFDFNGNDAANVFVTSNPHTDRLRLYWLDLKRGKWEFLGGQTWGLQTPNRVGVSPNPADLSLGYHEDAGIGTGYNYTRAGEFRAAYHFNDEWVWAVAVQNPQQYVGVGEVVFPFLFNAQLGPQFDAGNNAGTPNVAPDIMTKLAFDKKFMGAHQFHFEVGGMETAAKATTIGLTPNFVSHTTVGGGVFGDVLVDLWRGADGRNVKFVGSGMWGYGVGRYLNGLAPGWVVKPDGTLSGVHSGNAVLGVEALVHPKAQLGLYYGGMYAQRNFFLDPTNPVPGRFAGFGAPNSPNTANRSVQQGFIDWTQTLWRNPQYGAVYLVNQVSYITRSPWFVAPGAPKNAHLTMAYMSLRYALP
jgi:hypothetical protein